MKRLNITLPEELTQDLQNILNKSRFIAEDLKEQLDQAPKTILG